ncbi:Chloramphenicol acetyltransferase-like domain-containing protein [Rozella allomycis CSF55]|uniref:Dihydrolipoamide acetyltransferase component of pyruvate dehydrogenase complex n=1 Tax=Rozella allomycis (strain CSF55) TaxID=988480 RepID=A0A075B3X4_ROZAC|nr:Chloramphenicol acetyltransferase-like domain-containing protein [Rozella allomycis CSF55]|eukprot:EPZ35658.1 Chloramphenicol acetyltransferase-like domain-containing protein [Rozella allomycis CSF55]
MLSRRLLANALPSFHSKNLRLYHSSKINFKVMPFLLADIGEGITEVQIVQWFVKNGDKVAQFQKIAEVQSDKAAVEITSKYDGVVVKTYYKENETAKVGQPLCDIDTFDSPEEESNGDKVAQFQKIAEVQSDKAAVEITSKYDGVVVKTYYKENETAKVGKPLCDIDTFDSLDEESVKTKNDSKNLDQTGGQTEKAKETSKSMLMIDNDPNLGILATPAIRRIAKENSIDLSKIKGTGKDGRIMKEDVLMLASNNIREEIKPQKITQLPTDRTLPVETKPLNGVQKAMIKSMTNALKVPHFGYYDEFCLDQLKSIKKELVDILDEPSTKLSFMPFFIKAASVALKKFPIMNASLDLENNQDVLMLASNNIREEIKPQKITQLPTDRTLPVETKPLNGVQKAMIKSMTNALKVPHFGYYDEICLDQLKSIKKELVDILDEPSTKLSFMPFFIKAASVALKEFPIMNASLDLENNQVIYHHYHNIGVAIDSPQGLVVPNIKNVQDKSVVEIAKDLNKLIEAAKQNQLKPADFANGTFTLSNVGTVGGTYTSPILVLPEVVIGALGKAQTLPRFDESGQVYPSLIAKISWSADHRIIDGASLARFSNKWKSYIENPKRMILDF